MHNSFYAFLPPNSVFCVCHIDCQEKKNTHVETLGFIEYLQTRISHWISKSFCLYIRYLATVLSKSWRDGTGCKTAKRKGKTEKKTIQVI